MSQIMTEGLADPCRWIGVAACMVDYLDQWLAADPPQRMPPPRGAMAGARRFLNLVLDGIAISRREEPHGRASVSVALANLTLAVEALIALPGAPPGDLEAVRASIISFLGCMDGLNQCIDGVAVREETVRTLRAFFGGLQRECERQHHLELVLG